MKTLIILVIPVAAICFLPSILVFGWSVHHQHQHQHHHCHTTKSFLHHTRSYNNNNNILLHATGTNDADADDLQEKARKLREEINSFEQEKIQAEQKEQQIQQQAIEAKQKAKDYYCAILPILKPDGSTQEEKVEFKPVSPNQDTCIKVLEGNLPLGMILEEGDAAGTVVVDQVAEGSNSELAGVQVGDILRACTACMMNMETPTWQLLAGGIGQPKTKRMMFVVDNQKFENVMEAIGSNRMDTEGRPVLLVVERKR